MQLEHRVSYSAFNIIEFFFNFLLCRDCVLDNNCVYFWQHVKVTFAINILFRNYGQTAVPARTSRNWQFEQRIYKVPKIFIFDSQLRDLCLSVCPCWKTPYIYGTRMCVYIYILCMRYAWHICEILKACVMYTYQCEHRKQVLSKC